MFVWQTFPQMTTFRDRKLCVVLPRIINLEPVLNVFPLFRNFCCNESSKKLPTSNWIFIYSPYTDILWKTLTLIESIEAFFWFFESETNEKYQNWNAQKNRNSNRDKCNHSCQIIFFSWFSRILKGILTDLSLLYQITFQKRKKVIYLAPSLHWKFIRSLTM